MKECRDQLTKSQGTTTGSQSDEIEKLKKENQALKNQLSGTTPRTIQPEGEVGISEEDIKNFTEKIITLKTELENEEKERESLTQRIHLLHERMEEHMSKNLSLELENYQMASTQITQKIEVLFPELQRARLENNDIKLLRHRLDKLNKMVDNIKLLASLAKLM